MIISCNNCFPDDDSPTAQLDLPKECQDFCYYKSFSYSSGSKLCLTLESFKAGEFICSDGRWRSTGNKCESSPASISNGTTTFDVSDDCYTCRYDDNKFSVGSLVCQDGNIMVCRDGSWRSTGRVCTQ